MGASRATVECGLADDAQGAYGLKEGAPPRAWTERIAKHIKRVAGQHMLVIDGSDGLYVQQNGQIIPGLTIPSIDIVSDHFYPLNALQVASDYGCVRPVKPARSCLEQSRPAVRQRFAAIRRGPLTSQQ